MGGWGRRKHAHLQSPTYCYDEKEQTREVSHGPQTGQESWGYRVIRCLDGGTSLHSTVCQPCSAGTEPTSGIWTQTRVKEEMEVYTRRMNLCRIYSQQMKTEPAVTNNCTNFSSTEKTESLSNELSNRWDRQHSPLPLHASLSGLFFLDRAADLGLTSGVSPLPPRQHP